MPTPLNPAITPNKCSSQPESCAICLDQILGSENLKIQKCCKQQFHQMCIDRWYQTKSINERTCPLCRAQEIQPLNNGNRKIVSFDHNIEKFCIFYSLQEQLNIIVYSSILGLSLFSDPLEGSLLLPVTIPYFLGLTEMDVNPIVNVLKITSLVFGSIRLFNFINNMNLI